MKWLLLLLVSCFALSCECSKARVLPCGDWSSYRNEHCFKVFESAGVQSFENAEKTCGQEGGKLITISYPEVQAFLTNLLFVKDKIIDDIWIGASFDVEMNENRWQDNSSLVFTNWAENYPRNRLNYCVLMSSDPDTLGKWVDEPCQRRNLVVCQKKPSLQLSQLQELLFQVRQDQVDNQEENEAAKKKLTENLASAKSDLAGAKSEIVSAKSEIALIKRNPVPVGFIYVQLPFERTPAQIWPTATWLDVSSTYANVFFRVVGANAAPFGTVQSENAPRLNYVSTGKVSSYSESGVSVPSSGSSSRLYSGSGMGPHWAMSFQNSGGEVRPRNLAVRIWKRMG